MARQYQIGQKIISEDVPDFTDQLAEIHFSKIRPLCLCRQPGVPMYVATIGEQLLVKRMPLTGGDHDPQCPSYEPPYELSGLGPLIGKSILLNGIDGTAALKIDFSLTKRGGRSQATEPTPTNDGPVKNDPKKLSLRGLLHYLWHQGGLTEWTAHWAGKRHWFQVRNHLMEAARMMTVKGGVLADRLFVPETFRSDDKAAIEQRRMAALANSQAPASGPRPLMMLVGEVKEFEPARSGVKIIIKHMPGFLLMMEDGTWRRLQSRYDPDLELWKATETSHLIMIATFGTAPSGISNIEEIALMTVSEQWLPIESHYEQRLVEHLARLSIKSVKGLRFDLARTQPIAAATLPYRRPRPLALYVVPPTAYEEFEAKLTDAIEARPDMEAWVWRVAEGEIPDIPAS